MSVKLLVGMNQLDAAIASAGSIEDIFAFCALNGIGLTDDLEAGTFLQGTGQTYQASSVVTNNQVVSKVVKVMAGQTLFDMAMQQLGNIEAVFALALLNAKSITADLIAGAAINYSLAAYSPQILKVYQDNGYKPASGLNTPGSGPMPVLLSGIGYWAIEYDFVVS